MANELQSLSQIFQKRIFRIPDYQRGYAWRKEQLRDFWEDLLNLPDRHYHYTGMLSIKRLSDKECEKWGEDQWLLDEDYEPYHVVDGQQRLTTCIILINELINKIKSVCTETDERNIYVNSSSTVTFSEARKNYIVVTKPNRVISTYLFGYETDNPSAEYLIKKIFKTENVGSVTETFYTKNLKFAKEFFDQNLDDLYKSKGNDIDCLLQLYKKLTDKLKFNIHEIDNDYDVFVAFETMNNRGKKLSNLELLKNRLIYLTTIYDDNVLDNRDKSRLRKDINDAWKEIYKEIGLNDNYLLNDDEFLRAHWIVYFQYTRKRGDDYIRFLLTKFSAKNVFEKVAVSLKEDTENEVFEELYEDEPEDVNSVIIEDLSKLPHTEISEYVKSIQDFAKYWYCSYFPYDLKNDVKLDKKIQLKIDRLNRIGIGYFRPLVAVLLYLHDKKDDNIAGILDKLERFIFIHFRAGTYQSTYKSSEFNRDAHSLYKGNTTVEKVASKIDEYLSSNAADCAKSFVNRMNNNFRNYSGYFSWHSLRYFQYEYEYTLFQKDGVEKIDWKNFSKSEKDKFSIEHILPQTPTNEYWRSRFGMYSPDQMKSLTGALGNLLPLSQSINSSLQNDGFDKKKSPVIVNGELKRRGYSDGCHSEIEVSREEEWTAEHIYNRSKKLLEFMNNRWTFGLSEGQIEELIHLEFLN